MNAPGFLLVIEGGDGAGKSTLASGLQDRLQAQGVQPLRTFEPTDGPIGQRLRALIRAGREGMTPREEFSLFHEDRRQHVQEVVRPALARGELVLQDRSYLSTVAYQAERGLDPAWLLAQSLEIAPRPDLVLFVDIDPELALARIRAGRAGGTDSFERLEAQQRVRARFREMALTRLDGALPPAALLDQAWSHLQPALRERGLL